MKEMKYSAEEKREVLDEGNYQGYNYVIMNYGLHPCAYIEIPEGHHYYQQLYDTIKLDCHGGVTYSGFRNFETGRGEQFYIGWDYSHVEDYSGLRLMFNDNRVEEHHWTTEEILEEVKNVILQIVEDDEYWEEAGNE